MNFFEYHYSFTFWFLLSVLPTQALLAQNIETEKQVPKLSTKLVRLNPVYPVWIDQKNKILIADGEICLREGALEMFACLRGSKEHESIVAIPSKAFILHAGLLAIGAETGKPVSFDPEFTPPSGTEIEIFVTWKNPEGKSFVVKANDWIRHARTKKTLKPNWVFAGSYNWKDEATGEVYYSAEGGEVICVSNFSTAMLDIPVESSQQNRELFFLAYTERIPPLGTKVRLFFIPKKVTGEGKPSEKKDDKVIDPEKSEAVLDKEKNSN